MFRTLETFLVMAAENLSNKTFCLGLVRQEKPPGRPGRLGTLILSNRCPHRHVYYAEPLLTEPLLTSLSLNDSYTRTKSACTSAAQP